MGQDLLPVLAQKNDMRIVEVEGQPVVTARDLAKALEYRKDNAVTKIYDRDRNSFTDKDSFVVDMRRFIPKVGMNLRGGDPHVRVFTKRGALKICMKSNQPRAVAVQEMLIDLYEAVEGRRMIPVEALQGVQQRLDELATEVRRLVVAQEAKIVYLPRSCRPRSTDNEAVEFFKRLFEENPGRKVSDAIRVVKKTANECGWRVGSDKAFYRMARKLR